MFLVAMAEQGLKDFSNAFDIWNLLFLLIGWMDCKNKLWAFRSNLYLVIIIVLKN